MTTFVDQPGGALYLDHLNVGRRSGHSLALLSDVSRMVNEFAGGVFLTRAKWHAGDAIAKDPLSLMRLDAKRCGDIILGRDPTWAPQPWNDERRLGVTLRLLLPAETAEYGDSGTALFMWLAAQLVAVSEEVETDRLTEDAAKPHIARLCVDVAGRIMGTGNIPK
ncbi:MAG: hypothetical protein ACJ75S_07220 [Solirubrobacterales bacterium]|jgi:hypothetical protein